MASVGLGSGLLCAGIRGEGAGGVVVLLTRFCSGSGRTGSAHSLCCEWELEWEGALLTREMPRLPSRPCRVSLAGRHILPRAGAVAGAGPALAAVLARAGHEAPATARAAANALWIRLKNPSQRCGGA